VCATHTSQKKRAGWAVPHAAGAVERLARDRVRLWNDGWWEQTDVWRRRIGYTPQARCVCDGARPTTSEPPRRSNPNKQTRYEVRVHSMGVHSLLCSTHTFPKLSQHESLRACVCERARAVKRGARVCALQWRAQTRCWQRQDAARTVNKDILSSAPTR
jgi:hypothetical protein